MKTEKGKQSSVSIFEIDQLLPQTQCTECGFNGCLPYAEALAQKTAPINLCPPGGKETVIKLAQLLKISPNEYLDSHKTKQPSVAIIDENECIGCKKCITACPIDAIIGTGKMMHTIIEHECTGCGLCIEPCPVDCIELQEVENNNYDKEIARNRFNAKEIRKLKEEHEKAKQYREKTTVINKNTDDKKAFIQAALKRVKVKAPNA